MAYWRQLADSYRQNKTARQQAKRQQWGRHVIPAASQMYSGIYRRSDNVNPVWPKTHKNWFQNDLMASNIHRKAYMVGLNPGMIQTHSPTASYFVLHFEENYWSMEEVNKSKTRNGLRNLHGDYDKAWQNQAGDKRCRISAQSLDSIKTRQGLHSYSPWELKLPILGCQCINPTDGSTGISAEPLQMTDNPKTS